MNNMYDDMMISMINESILYDNTKIKEKLKNYNKEFSSDQDMINKFKSITGYEVIGLPKIDMVNKYGIDIAKNYTLFCKSGKKVYRVTLSGICLANQAVGKLKCTTVKLIKFNKNSNIDVFEKVIAKCKGKAILKSINVSTKKIKITFYQCNRTFIDTLAQTDFNTSINKIGDSIIIYNNINIGESAIEETMALSAINPIKATSKPFILKLNPLNNSIFGGNFALSPDIVSDKYFVVNEDGKLEYVDEDYIDDFEYSLYEFTGDKQLLGRLWEAYKNQSTVGPDFIYTCLANRSMLMEDQIDFDNNFTLVDVEAKANAVKNKLFGGN